MKNTRMTTQLVPQDTPAHTFKVKFPDGMQHCPADCLVEISGENDAWYVHDRVFFSATAGTDTWPSTKRYCTVFH